MNIEITIFSCHTYYIVSNCIIKLFTKYEIITFCFVISASSLFPIKCLILHNHKQDLPCLPWATKRVFSDMLLLTIELLNTPKLQHNYDCKLFYSCTVILTTVKQTQIQAFIGRSSSPDPSWAASYPVTINSKARTNKHVARYKLKCCCFKRHVLRQDRWTLIGSRLHSSQIATCRVYDELCLNDARQARVFFMSSLSEMIRKIIWIIFFSVINYINSALHLTQT